jgi:hypothetical protein
MTTSRRTQPLTLGWQAWAIVACVLTLVVLGGVFLLGW